MKAGFKTTEFWVNIAAVVYGALVSNGVIHVASPVVQAVNIAGTVAVALGYTAARTFIKSK